MCDVSRGITLGACDKATLDTSKIKDSRDWREQLAVSSCPSARDIVIQLTSAGEVWARSPRILLR